MLNRRNEEGRYRHPPACTCVSCSRRRISGERETQPQEVAELNPRAAADVEDVTTGKPMFGPRTSVALIIGTIALLMAGLVLVVVWQAKSI